jgi:hypothetical protein
VEMLIYTPGGRERTGAEYRALFAAAGLTPVRTAAAGGTVSVLEGRRSP